MKRSFLSRAVNPSRPKTATYYSESGPLTPDEVRFQALVKDILKILATFAADAGIRQEILASALRDYLTANHLARETEKKP